MKNNNKFNTKLLVSILTSLAVNNAYAVATGMYLGLMLGPATNSGGPQQVQAQATPPFLVQATPRSQQFATRLFIGYKINAYAGFEGGLTYFTGIKYSTVNNINTCSSVQVRIRDFDAVVKGTFPLGCYFDIYGKAGAALLYETTSGSLNPALKMQCGKSTYVTKVRPTASFGASYDLSQNWVVDLSYNLLLTSAPVNNVSFIAIGLSYHFVDRYCGQFLCDD